VPGDLEIRIRAAFYLYTKLYTSPKVQA